MKVRTFGELAHDIFRFMADRMRADRHLFKASSPCLTKIKSEIEKYASKDPNALQSLDLHYSITSTPADSRLEHVIDEGIDIISPTTFANHIKRDWLAAEILYFKFHLICSASTAPLSSLFMIFDNLSTRISMHVGAISALQGKNTASTFETVLKHATFNELEEKSFTTLREHLASPQNIKDAMAAIQNMHRDVRSIKSYSRKAMEDSRYAANCGEWLMNDRIRKKSENSKRGKENQANGNCEARERAKHDMAEALAKVRKRVLAEEKKHGAGHGSVLILPICRNVCKHFKPLSNRKDTLGNYVNCDVLCSSNGKPVKPETLAKRYREQFGTKKAQKKKPHKKNCT